MFSCSHFSNFLSDPIGKQMSKRGQEATSSEGSSMAKTKSMIPVKARPINLVSDSPWSARENPPQDLGYPVNPVNVDEGPGRDYKDGENSPKCEEQIGETCGRSRAVQKKSSGKQHESGCGGNCIPKGFKNRLLATHHPASGEQGGVTMSYLYPHRSSFPMEDYVWWVSGEVKYHTNWWCAIFVEKKRLEATKQALGGANRRKC